MSDHEKAAEELLEYIVGVLQSEQWQGLPGASVLPKIVEALGVAENAGQRNGELALAYARLLTDVDMLTQERDQLIGIAKPAARFLLGAGPKPGDITDLAEAIAAYGQLSPAQARQVNEWAGNA